MKQTPATPDQVICALTLTILFLVFAIFTVITGEAWEQRKVEAYILKAHAEEDRDNAKLHKSRENSEDDRAEAQRRMTKYLNLEYNE